MIITFGLYDIVELALWYCLSVIASFFFFRSRARSYTVVYALLAALFWPVVLVYGFAKFFYDHWQ
jgi:hypothetical protein